MPDEESVVEGAPENEPENEQPNPETPPENEAEPTEETPRPAPVQYSVDEWVEKLQANPAVLKSIPNRMLTAVLEKRDAAIREEVQRTAQFQAEMSTRVGKFVAAEESEDLSAIKELEEADPDAAYYFYMGKANSISGKAGSAMQQQQAQAQALQAAVAEAWPDQAQYPEAFAELVQRAENKEFPLRSMADVQRFRQEVLATVARHSKPTERPRTPRADVKGAIAPKGTVSADDFDLKKAGSGKKLLEAAMAGNIKE